MLRSVAIIAAAIGVVNPTLHKPARTAYAKTIRAAASKHDMDPLTLVAFAWEESNFRPSAVSPDGKDIGLMQLRVEVTRACKGKPADAPSCVKARACAMNGHCAIRKLARTITEARKLCRKRTGRPALFHRWLALLGGLNHPRHRGVWCAQRQVMVKGRKVWRDVRWKKLRGYRAVRQVIACRRNLIRGRKCHRERRASRKRSR